jgi:hypothetical protein
VAAFKKGTPVRVRYRETGKTDDVELRQDATLGPVLVGRRNPCFLEDDALPDPDQPYFIGPDDFDDWELVEATEVDRVQLRQAGFRVEVTPR